MIFKTAKYVSKEGDKAELLLKLRNSSNSNFSFLLPENSYYPYFQFLKEKHHLVEEWLNLNSIQLSSEAEKKYHRLKKSKLMVQLLNEKKN